MLALLGAEVLSLVAKEVIKHGPEIAEAIMKELEHVAAAIYKHAYPDEKVAAVALDSATESK